MSDEPMSKKPRPHHHKVALDYDDVDCSEIKKCEAEIDSCAVPSKSKSHESRTTKSATTSTSTSTSASASAPTSTSAAAAPSGPSLTIILKTPSGKAVSLSVPMSETVGGLRRRAAASGSVPFTRAVLAARGGKLLEDDSMTLTAAGLSNESTVTLKMGEPPARGPDFEVMVKLSSGKCFSQAINGLDDISELRRRVATQAEVTADRIVLQFGSRDLNDGISCAEVGLMRECAVKATVRDPPPKPAVPTPVSDTLSESEKQALLSSFAEGATSKTIDILFCFDTTGSMYSVLQQVRDKVEQSCERLVKEIPDIRIAIMGIGDFCDANSTYVTEHIDLTNDARELSKFARVVRATGGGDAPEAYEWGLKMAQTLSWREGSSKALVMIGDCPPHAPSYTKEDVFWKDEVDKLATMGVKIYGVHAQPSNEYKPFYEEMAKRTGGLYLRFSNFNLITDMFLAVCYREANKEKLEEFTQEIKSDGRMNEAMAQMMDSLAKPNMEKTKEEDRVEDKPLYPYDWWDRRNDHGSPQYKLLEGKWVSAGATSVPKPAPVYSPSPTPKYTPGPTSSAATAPSVYSSGGVPEHKLVYVGGGGVGKSTIVIQFVQCHFITEYDPTIEDSYRKQINVDGTNVLLDILDTAGQEEYSAMRDQYMRVGQGFAIVYSITSRSSFDEATTFREQIMRVKDASSFPCVLVGNKVDLDGERQVTTEEGTALAASWSVPFFESSAKTRVNIDEQFTELSRQVSKFAKAAKPPPEPSSRCSLQ